MGSRNPPSCDKERSKAGHGPVDCTCSHPRPEGPWVITGAGGRVTHALAPMRLKPTSSRVGCGAVGAGGERQEPSARCGSPDERACQGEQRPPRVRPCLVRKAGGEPCRPQPPLEPSLSAWRPPPCPWSSISCVTLGKLFNFSVPSAPQLEV